METGPLDFIMHVDKHLAALVEAYPVWIYGLMFLIVFAETGLIFMAILPGDSLLFAAGALAAGNGKLEILLLLPLMIAASFCGDQVNYLIGHQVGEKPFKRNSRLFSWENLKKAKRFYSRHGPKAIILGRFIPVLRSVTPLVASVSGMPYLRFILFSLIGASLWASIFVLLGYFIGNLPAVKERFGLVVGAVILISLIPALVETLVERLRGHGRGRKHQRTS